MRPAASDGRDPIAPAATPSPAHTTPEETEAELDALCAAYEAQALREDGECLAGCDWPEDPLSPTGCRW